MAYPEVLQLFNDKIYLVRISPTNVVDQNGNLRKLWYEMGGLLHPTNLRWGTIAPCLPLRDAYDRETLTGTITFNLFSLEIFSTDD